jgi:hypothetical protein
MQNCNKQNYKHYTKVLVFEEKKTLSIIPFYIKRRLYKACIVSPASIHMFYLKITKHST